MSDDWIAVEHVREILDDVRGRLKAGSEGSGVTLSADECLKVLACLQNPAFPNTRPKDNTLRDLAIAADCALRERGMSHEQAVAETAKLFRCSKWTVNSVLRAQDAKDRLKK